MRNLYTSLIATVAIVNQAIAPVAPHLAKLVAQPAEAASATPSQYDIKINMQADSALDVVAKRGNFDKEVLVPLRAAQAAKAQADAEAAAKAQADQAAAQQAAAARAAQAARASSPVPTLSGSDAEYKLYIYNHESGNNPARANGAGCLGLGQACPGSKLLAVCPTLDYACEDAYFTNYAISRYGSWAGAYSFWLSHRWW
jgi:hypothetical protein